MFKYGIICINDIMNRNGGVMQLSKIYGDFCSIQTYNQLIAALPQKWRRQVEKGEGRELVCLPCIKDTNWLKGTGINIKIYQFHLRTIFFNNCYIYSRLQNKWEEIFNVPIPWHMVYELVQKTTLDSTLSFSILMIIHCSKKLREHLNNTI